MCTPPLALAALLLAVAAPLAAQSTERIDPAPDAIIVRDASVETLARGFAWTVHFAKVRPCAGRASLRAARAGAVLSDRLRAAGGAARE